MRKLFMLVLLLGSLSMPLRAYYAEYYIKSVGLKVAKLTFDHNSDQKRITAKAKSIFTSKIFPRIDNEYIVNYKDNYLPENYLRRINQDSNQDVVNVAYNRDKGEAHMRMSREGSSDVYRIQAGTRDYFSFMAMLSREALDSGRFIIDGNGKLWCANLVFEKHESINTAVGRIDSRRYELTFTPLDSKEAPYIDMVTHNLLHESTRVNLWISEEKVVLKATVRKGLMAMNWELIEYRP